MIERNVSETNFETSFANVKARTYTVPKSFNSVYYYPFDCYVRNSTVMSYKDQT